MYLRYINLLQLLTEKRERCLEKEKDEIGHHQKAPEPRTSWLSTTDTKVYNHMS